MYVYIYIYIRVCHASRARGAHSIASRPRRRRCKLGSEVHKYSYCILCDCILCDYSCIVFSTLYCILCDYSIVYYSALVGAYDNRAQC